MRRRAFLRSTGSGLALAGLAAAPVDATLTGHRDGGQGGSAPSKEPGGQEPLAPVARLPVTSESHGFQATEAVVTPDGRHGFVSKLDGFHAIDVTDPANPDIVATVEDILADGDGPILEIFDIKYDRGRLLVASNSGTPYAGIALFDVRDPTDPQLVRSYETTYGIHNCFLSGDFAYLTTGSTLDVIEIGAREPALVGQWTLTDYDERYEQVSSYAVTLHDIYVQDERAYLAYWDAGSWILDVSDPADPTYLGHVAAFDVEDLADGAGSLTLPPGNDHYVQPNDDGTLMGVGKESWARDGDADETAGGPSGVALWDVADPSEPTHLATIEPPPVPDGESGEYVDGYWTTAHNFDIVGETLYSAWYRGGVRVHDIADPSDPVELGAWDDGDTAEFWTARVGIPGEFFVASSYRNPTDPAGAGAVYVFPDPGEVVTPTSSAGGDSTATSSASTTERRTMPATEPSSPGSTETPGPATTATPSPPSTETPEPTATENHETTSAATPAWSETPTTVDESGPGFGVLAGLSALGAGAWRGIRGTDTES